MIATTQKRLSSNKFAEVIALIERQCKNVEDITPASAVPGYWFGKYPLPPLPLWDSVALDCIRAFDNGVLPVAFAEKADARFYQRVMDVISPHGNFHFDIPFKLPDFQLDGLRLRLSIEDKTMFIGFSYLPSYDVADHPGILRDVEKMLRLFELPFVIELKNKLYTLKHTAKGGVIFRPDEGSNEPPSSPVGNLPGLSQKEVTEKFRKMLNTSGLKAKEGKWYSALPFKCPNQKNPLTFYNDFNKLGLPGKNVECTFEWHLKSYKLFREISRMAEFTGEQTSGQDLLRFEWEGHPGKLNAVCGVDEQFKLYFEFKDPKDGYPFLQYLKEKLKIGCTIY